MHTGEVYQYIPILRGKGDFWSGILSNGCAFPFNNSFIKKFIEVRYYFFICSGIWKYPSIGGNYNHHWVALCYASRHGRSAYRQHGQHAQVDTGIDMEHQVACCMLRAIGIACADVVCTRGTQVRHGDHAERGIFVLLCSVCKGLDNNITYGPVEFWQFGGFINWANVWARAVGKENGATKFNR